jgi:hypothetical protein
MLVLCLLCCVSHVCQKPCGEYPMGAKHTMYMYDLSLHMRMHIPVNFVGSSQAPTACLCAIQQRPFPCKQRPRFFKVRATMPMMLILPEASEFLVFISIIHGRRLTDLQASTAAVSRVILAAYASSCSLDSVLSSSSSTCIIAALIIIIICAPLGSADEEKPSAKWPMSTGKWHCIYLLYAVVANSLILACCMDEHPTETLIDVM